MTKDNIEEMKAIMQDNNIKGSYNMTITPGNIIKGLKDRVLTDSKGKVCYDNIQVIDSTTNRIAITTDYV